MIWKEDAGGLPWISAEKQQEKFARKKGRVEETTKGLLLKSTSWRKPDLLWIISFSFWHFCDSAEGSENYLQIAVNGFDINEENTLVFPGGRKLFPGAVIWEQGGGKLHASCQDTLAFGVLEYLQALSPILSGGLFPALGCDCVPSAAQHFPVMPRNFISDSYQWAAPASWECDSLV
jgi:hypothetical protein